MIYGGEKYEQTDECSNFENCTIVSFEEFGSYDLTAYNLYRLTLGESFDLEDLSKIDKLMLNPLIGSYVGITALVLANIFIALLSATFQRVYEKAEAYIILQRGIEILNTEKSMSYEARKRHIIFINKIGSPYIDSRYNETITSLEDRIINLEKEAKEQTKQLSNIANNFEYTVYLILSTIINFFTSAINVLIFRVSSFVHSKGKNVEGSNFAQNFVDFFWLFRMK